MDRIILHSDLNNFFASVECLMFPEYKDKPVAVCGDPEKRHGIVLAKNQLAKSFGVKTAETILEAQKKCPNLILLPSHPDKYDEYSKRVKLIYYRYTDRIEPFGLDECWLDVTESIKLFGDGKTIADSIRNTVKDEIGLTVSIGVSFTKSFAKLGSDMKKPDATTVIDRANYRDLAWNIPIQDMMYVGRATCKKLLNLNVRTIGDLAKANEKLLTANFGVNGLKLKEAARGYDEDEVSVFKIKELPKSVGHGTTTFKDMSDYETIRTVIFSLCDMIAIRLRRYGLFASGVGIYVKDNTFCGFSKRLQLQFSTKSGSAIANFAFELFKNNYDLTVKLPVRAISVFTYGLTTECFGTQIDIFKDDKSLQKKEKLENVLDNIRSRYGISSITRAGYMGNQYVLDSFSEDDDSLPFYRG